MSGLKFLTGQRCIDPIELTLFSDLLVRVSRYKSLNGYAYAGMSGFAADDLRRLSRELGLKHLLAFDENDEIVKRQRFNLPSLNSHARIETLEEFSSRWPEILSEEGIEDAANFILWVRKDSFDKIGQGVRFFQQLVSLLPSYGIARITLAIDYEVWSGPAFDDHSVRRTASAREKTVSENLAEHVSDFLQVGAIPEQTNFANLCRLLAEAYGNAAAQEIGTQKGLTFEPLSVVRYGVDGAELTLTGMVIPADERPALRARLEDSNWPFSSPGWSDVHYLQIPDITLKERLELEASDGNPSIAEGRLNFDLDKAVGVPGLFSSFSKQHRFLPSIVAVEI